jgi:hypothetical protein
MILSKYKFLLPDEFSISPKQANTKAFLIGRQKIG